MQNENIGGYIVSDLGGALQQRLYGKVVAMYS